MVKFGQTNWLTEKIRASHLTHTVRDDSFSEPSQWSRLLLLNWVKWSDSRERFRIPITQSHDPQQYILGAERVGSYCRIWLTEKTRNSQDSARERNCL